MTVEAEVLAANRSFYDAFASGDLRGIEDVWAREHPVACVHPGWEVLLGREHVLSSFHAILASAESPRIRVAEEQAFIHGDMAFVTCLERIGEAELAATNVFALEHGVWRIVHHHASPIAPERFSDETQDPSELN